MENMEMIQTIDTDHNKQIELHEVEAFVSQQENFDEFVDKVKNDNQFRESLKTILWFDFGDIVSDFSFDSNNVWERLCLQVLWSLEYWTNVDLNWNSWDINVLCNYFLSKIEDKIDWLIGEIEWVDINQIQKSLFQHIQSVLSSDKIQPDIKNKYLTDITNIFDWTKEITMEDVEDLKTVRNTMSFWQWDDNKSDADYLTMILEANFIAPIEWKARVITKCFEDETMNVEWQEYHKHDMEEFIWRIQALDRMYWLNIYEKYFDASFMQDAFNTGENKVWLAIFDEIISNSDESQERKDFLSMQFVSNSNEHWEFNPYTGNDSDQLFSISINWQRISLSTVQTQYMHAFLEFKHKDTQYNDTKNDIAETGWVESVFWKVEDVLWMEKIDLWIDEAIEESIENMSEKERIILYWRIATIIPWLPAIPDAIAATYDISTASFWIDSEWDLKNGRERAFYSVMWALWVLWVVTFWATRIPRMMTNSYQIQKLTEVANRLHNSLNKEEAIWTAVNATKRWEDVVNRYRSSETRVGIAAETWDRLRDIKMFDVLDWSDINKLKDVDVDNWNSFQKINWIFLDRLVSRFSSTSIDISLIAEKASEFTRNFVDFMKVLSDKWMEWLRVRFWNIENVLWIWIDKIEWHFGRPSAVTNQIL